MNVNSFIAQITTHSKLLQINPPFRSYAIRPYNRLGRMQYDPTMQYCNFSLLTTNN